MSRKSHSPLIAGSALVVLLASCGKTEAPQQTESQPTAAPLAVVIPPPPPPKPTHYYALEEDGEYGYEEALSENDRKAGKAASPLRMIRYLGEKDGLHKVASIASSTEVGVMSCKAPCEFIKIEVVVGGKVAQRETVRAVKGTMAQIIMADAMNGELKPYTAVKW